ncbi:MAG: hypothetical protein NZL98_10125, partial [Anaerolineales bacterium]|nr:hypothetical protein [Anaerolineales bacterium]
LARVASPAFRGGSRREVRGESLCPALEEFCRERNVPIGLGVICSLEGEEQIAELALRLPTGCKYYRLTYGGHPKNLERWAVNMALDRLRRMLLEIVT